MADVEILMGSKSDYEIMKKAGDVLDSFGISWGIHVLSAHRNPEGAATFAKEAAGNGVKVIIGGAGGAAHLPGMTAAKTHLPVLGVPVESKVLRGVDSLLSIAQMPAGVPVGTLAIGRAGAINAAQLASAMLANNDEKIRKALIEFRQQQT